ncbi:unnamed protein product, partial [Protopolystoma xenopodis]
MLLRLARLTDDVGEMFGNVPRPQTDFGNDDAYNGLRISIIFSSCPYETTALLAAPSKPLDLKLVSNTESGMEFSWSPPEHQNGEIRDYELSMIPTSESSFAAPITVNAASLLTATVKEALIEVTQYSVTVTATTMTLETGKGGGRGPPSDTITVMSLPGQPSAPLAFSYAKPTANSVTMNWIKPANIRGTLAGYTLSIEATEDAYGVKLPKKKEIVVKVEADTSEYMPTGL